MFIAGTAQVDNLADSEDIDMAGLDEQIGFVLRLAQVAVFKDVTASLRPFALRPADFSALLITEANPGLKQQALGEALSVQGPNLVTMLDQLAERGLLVRQQSQADRRAYALFLTAKGAALLNQAKQAHREHQARVRAGLRGTDAAGLVAALRRLAAL